MVPLSIDGYRPSPSPASRSLPSAFSQRPTLVDAESLPMQYATSQGEKILRLL